MNLSGLKVFAPASVANVSVGFDLLGFALDNPGDEIIVKEGKQKGLEIIRITGDKGKLPMAISKNTAGFAASELLKHLGEENRPISLEIHKKMPFSSGLGSSAASAVAGVMAINEYLGRPLSKKELLPFAVAGERVADGAFHADNVAPSLLGGLILVRDTISFDVVRLPVPPGIFVCVVHPQIELPTKESRAILKEHVRLSKHIKQSGNLAGFISSLYTSNIDLMRRSLHDLIIEPQRCHLIPFFNIMKEMALQENAIGFGISGAGPSVFALCESNIQAENVCSALTALLFDKKIPFDSYLSRINQQGAFKF